MEPPDSRTFNEDAWIDRLDKPADPVGRAQRQAAREDRGPAAAAAIRRLAGLLLDKAERWCPRPLPRSSWTSPAGRRTSSAPCGAVTGCSRSRTGSWLAAPSSRPPRRSGWTRRPGGPGGSPATGARMRRTRSGRPWIRASPSCPTARNGSAPRPGAPSTWSAPRHPRRRRGMAPARGPLALEPRPAGGPPGLPGPGRPGRGGQGGAGRGGGPGRRRLPGRPAAPPGAPGA